MCGPKIQKRECEDLEVIDIVVATWMWTRDRVLILDHEESTRDLTMGKINPK